MESPRECPAQNRMELKGNADTEGWNGTFTTVDGQNPEMESMEWIQWICLEWTDLILNRSTDGIFISLLIWLICRFLNSPGRTAKFAFPPCAGYLCFVA